MLLTKKEFERLFFSTKDPLYGYIRKFNIPEDEAEDILQQCFIRLWIKLDGMVEEAAILPLLYTYAKNLVIDSIRKSAVEIKHRRQYTSLKPVYTEPEQQLLSRESVKAVYDIIDQMPPKRRRVFLLKKEMGLSHAEIARQLNISTSMVEKHLSEAVSVLKGKLSSADLLYLLFVYTLSATELI